MLDQAPLVAEKTSDALAESWSFVSLSERWDFTILLFVVLLIASQWPRVGRNASALVFPASLLLFRKLALFLPLSGSISTEDQVFFWSTKAYWYAFVFVLLNGLAIAAIRFRERVQWDSLGCLFVIVPGLLIGGSYLLLPLTGAWSHIYSPVVTLVGASKLLLVSPLLWPIAWLTLLLQILLLIFSRGTSGREVNKLALACVVISAIVHFGLQRFTTAPAIVSELTTWERENEKDGMMTQFLAVWAAKLPQTAELRVNVVERTIPHPDRNYVDSKVIQSLNQWWSNLWPQQLPWNALLCGLGFLFLLAMVERLPIDDQWAGGKEP
jgi:hypothetical protein